MFSQFNAIKIEPDYADIFTSKKIRDKLKQKISIPAEKYKEEEDKIFLQELFLKINLLEQAILAQSKEPKRKKLALDELGDYEKFNKELEELNALREKLTKDNLAAWNLYIEAIKLAANLIEEDSKLQVNTKKELNLLIESLELTAIVVKQTQPFTPDKLKAIHKLGVDINKRVEDNLKIVSDQNKKDLAATEKTRRWVKFGIAVGAILLVAGLIALFTCLTAGAGLIPVGVTLLLFLGLSASGVVTSAVSWAKQLELVVKEKSLHETRKNKATHLHRFHQAIEKHAEDKNLMPKREDKPPQNPGNKK